MLSARRALLGGVVCALASSAASVRADVHLIRSATGSALIFNDNIGSGWRVNGAAPSDAYLIDRMSVSTPFDQVILTNAKDAGVDPQLVKSVMLVESNYNPRAVSKKGARGLMQLMPATARRYGVGNSFDAAENIKGGVRYLADLLAMFSGKVDNALAAYNAGEGAVARHSGIPPYAETQEYVRRALVAYRRTSVGLSVVGRPPVVGGDFRGIPTHVTAARIVRLDRGARQLSNVNAGPAHRAAPVLGRVDPDASVAQTQPAARPALGRVAP
jgi:hypothetical protein